MSVPKGIRVLALFLAFQLTVCPLLWAAPAAAAKPTLTVLGEHYFEHGAVHPINGTVGDTYFFAIKYQDLSGSAPKTGYPRLLIDTDADGDFNDSNDLNLTTDPMKPGTPNYSLGVDYSRNWVFDEPGTYSYAFWVVNNKNETAYIGPFDGPVVIKKQDHVPSDYMTTLGLFGLLIIVFVTVFFVLGMAAGQSMARKDRKRKQDELRRHE
jgi:hypothetical protein